MIKFLHGNGKQTKEYEAYEKGRECGIEDQEKYSQRKEGMYEGKYSLVMKTEKKEWTEKKRCERNLGKQKRRDQKKKRKTVWKKDEGKNTVERKRK